MEAERVLPKDIMFSILSLLPVKSLLRCKCVNKRWNSLISDPEFINIHFHHSSQSPKTSTLQPHVIKCPTLRVDPAKKMTPVEIFFDSCNGLVCMGGLSFTEDILLFNPATKLSKHVPPFNADFKDLKIVSLGFGCSAANGKPYDFKVVRIFCFKGGHMRPRVMVYSSESNSWTTIEVGFMFSLNFDKHHLIVNGNPYWVACIDGINALLGFDVTNSVFKIVQFPEKGKYPSMLLVDWEGSLGGIDCVAKDDSWLEWMYVWKYDDDERTWTRKMKLGSRDKVQVIDRCLVCSRFGKILGLCIDRKNMFIFDSKKNPAAVTVSELKKGSNRVFAYDESLAYVKGMKAINEEEEEEDYGELNDIGGLLLHIIV